MNREQVRQKILESVRQRRALNQKFEPTPLLRKFDIPFVVTFITPFLLFVIYSSAWVYDYFYLSFFGINATDFIELNILSSTAVQVFTLIFMLLSLIFILIVYLHAVYINNTAIAVVWGMLFSIWFLVNISVLGNVLNLKAINELVTFLMDSKNIVYYVLFIIFFPLIILKMGLPIIAKLIGFINGFSKEILFIYFIVFGIFMIIFFAFIGKNDALRSQSSSKILITQIDKKDYIVIKAYSNKIICKLKDTKDTKSPSIVIIQGTDNVIVKQQSLPIASQSAGQQ